jgi:multidrug transporter EmrE-like cation transporter
MSGTQTVASLTALSALGDFSLKAYALSGHTKTPDLLLGAGAYAGVVYVLQRDLAKKGVAWTNNMWNVGTSCLETAIAIWQGEQLTNTNLVGIALILVGAYLLNRE